MDNGIEMAIGIHAANNVMVAVLDNLAGIWFLFILLLLPIFIIIKRKKIKESFK